MTTWTIPTSWWDGTRAMAERLRDVNRPKGFVYPRDTECLVANDACALLFLKSAEVLRPGPVMLFQFEVPKFGATMRLVGETLRQRFLKGFGIHVA